MKKFIAFVVLTSILQICLSQSPLGIPYQAVLRDISGQPLLNTPVTTRFTLREQTPTGSISYQEIHTTATSNEGLIALTFGQGSPSIGTFETINWSQTIKFLQVETDMGNGFTEIGTQQLMSVPYALYSGAGGSASNSGNTLSTDSVLTLYATVTQSSCDFVVPEGEAWKVVAINRNSDPLSYTKTSTFSYCSPNNFGNYYCYYTPSYSELIQLGDLLLTVSGNSASSTGNGSVIFDNNNRPGIYTSNCSSCPSALEFTYNVQFWTFPNWNLPIWCISGQPIKSANPVFLTIEKYK